LSAIGASAATFTTHHLSVRGLGSPKAESNVGTFGSGSTPVEVTGDDNAHDVLKTLQIADDPQASLLFSFLDVSD
jgi:hypothetical protein